VIGLTKLVSEGFDEVRTLTQKDQRRSLFKRYRDERCPAGMDAKTEGGPLHKTPPEQSEYAVKITRKAHISKDRCPLMKNARALWLTLGDIFIQQS
jgi:hypothetical protein